MGGGGMATPGPPLEPPLAEISKAAVAAVFDTSADELGATLSGNINY
jgi:hypothetical protein